MSVERFLQPHYGARFFLVDGRDMFQHTIDSRNSIGPRVATKIDKENHPKLWADYQAAITVELDASLVKKKGK